MPILRAIPAGNSSPTTGVPAIRGFPCRLSPPYGEVGGGANTGRFDLRTRIGTIEVMNVAVTNESGTKMIDCREAARRYGCTMRYIRRLAADGRLSYEVVGGSYLFSAAEIEQIKRDAAAATGRERKRAEGFQPG